MYCFALWGLISTAQRRVFGLTPECSSSKVLEHCGLCVMQMVWQKFSTVPKSECLTKHLQYQNLRMCGRGTKEVAAMLLDVHGCNFFFSTLPYSCLDCLPVVIFLFYFHDVSASRPLLIHQKRARRQNVVPQQDKKTSTGRQSRQQQGRVEKKRLQPCT